MADQLHDNPSFRASTKDVLSDDYGFEPKSPSTAANSTNKKVKIGLALGGGGGRGWAHIGVIQRLEERGLIPDVIAGTSIGGVVGGAYVGNKLDRLEDWACRLNTFRILRFLDFRLWGGGMIGGSKLIEELESHFGDTQIDMLDRKFGTVATDLFTGQEIWLREGSLIQAMHSSYAIPGVFKPVPYGETLLVDGALVNPVPVSLARSLGADVVIAVNLNADMRNRHRAKSGLIDETLSPPHMSMQVTDFAERRLDSLVRPTAESPSVLNTLLAASNVMQERIARIRLAGNPPEISIAPRVGHIGILEFHRAKELIEEGRAAVDRATHAIEDALALDLT